MNEHMQINMNYWFVVFRLSLWRYWLGVGHVQQPSLNLVTEFLDASYNMFLPRDQQEEVLDREVTHDRVLSIDTDAWLVHSTITSPLKRLFPSIFRILYTPFMPIVYLWYTIKARYLRLWKLFANYKPVSRLFSDV